MNRKSRAKPSSPFRYFNSSPEVIRLVVMMYVRFPLSLRNVEDLLFERGIDICHETVRIWWNRIGPLFAGDIRSQRVSRMRGFRHWRWHLDEMYVKLNGEMVYLWRGLCLMGWTPPHQTKPTTRHALSFEAIWCLGNEIVGAAKPIRVCLLNDRQPNA